jgi:hypothetical protein
MLEVRTITLDPGGERPFDEEEWRDALVLVEQGAVELASATGASWRFATGDMLWLSGLWLRALNNPGAEPARLVAISPRPSLTPSRTPSG